MMLLCNSAVSQQIPWSLLVGSVVWVVREEAFSGRTKLQVIVSSEAD